MLTCGRWAFSPFSALSSAQLILPVPCRLSLAVGEGFAVLEAGGGGSGAGDGQFTEWPAPDPSWLPLLPGWRQSREEPQACWG
jgi:hypothetical protein